MKMLFLLLFWGLWFVNFSARTVFSPILPILEDEFAISHALAGLILSFVSLGYTITQFSSGLLSPRIGYKRTIIVGFAILTTALFYFRYAHTYASVVAVSLFIGFGGGIYLPSAIPLITTIFGRNNWGKVIAFHGTASSLSILAIPLLTALALRFFHWRDLCLILAAASLIVLGSFWVLSPDPRPEEEQRIRLSHILHRRDFWILTFLWIIAVSNGFGLYNVIPLFLVKEKGMPLEAANTVFGLSRIGGVFCVAAAGFLVDRYGAKKVLFILLLITGFSTTGIALANIFPLMAATLFVQATVSVAFFPVGQAAISMLTGANERSAFMGATIGSGMLIGLGVTPALLGAVADIWSFQRGIFFLGVLTTLSCGMVKYLQRI
jgi:MFS family permease